MPKKPNAYQRFLAEQLADPEFRAEFERERHEIETIDAIVNASTGCATSAGSPKPTWHDRSARTRRACGAF